MDYDVFLPGDYCFDVIYTGLPEFPTPGREIYTEGVTVTGGAMYITAASLHRLNVNTAWVACFGNDYYSQFVRTLAQDEGIDLALALDLDQPFRRVSTSLPYQGDRAFVSYMQPPPIDLKAYWRTAMQQCSFRHLHLGAILMLDQLVSLVEGARAHGATISMDCQDVPNLTSVRAWQRALSQVDIFMPNAREALTITGATTVDSALRRLMAWTPIVVIKDGANGAWIGSEGEITHVPAIHAGPVVDTTGAGDCFNAGFLLGYVVEKAPLTRCAEFGNVCGGLSVTQVGGATGAPTRAQLDAWLTRM